MKKRIMVFFIGICLFASSLFIVFTFFMNNLVYAEAPKPEATEERVVDGARIVEIIENAVGDFWEVIGLDRLFDLIIDFFRGIWDWMKTVFEAGLERTPE